MLRYFHCFSVFKWTGEKDSNTLRVDAYFFGKGKKNRFFKNIWLQVDRGERGCNGPVKNFGVACPLQAS